jgi:hypothetical protein
MHIDLKPSLLTGRGYLEGGSYEARSPFAVVFTVKLMGGGEAYIDAMSGKGLDPESMLEIGRQLKEQYGVHTVIAERNGKIRRYDMAAYLAARPLREALAEQPTGLGQTTVL